MGTVCSKPTVDSSADARLSGWKSGNRLSSIPIPFSNLNSFEKLARSSDFKEWISRNLDSDYLMSSILTDSHTSEALLDKVEFYKRTSPSRQKEILDHINDFELATVAGVELQLSETSNVCESELLMRMSALSSPFFRSFQMRLVALKGIEDCIISEKKVAQEERKTREYVPAALNSSSYPQLVFVLALMTCGVNFISVFPLCIDLLVDVDSRNSLIAPIENLCSTICSLSNLQLFECWSPLRRAPLKKVPLNFSSVVASSGNCPGAAVDGKPATYWLCSRSRATWTVDLEKTPGQSVASVNVVAIQIAWRPQQPSAAVIHNSAPKKLSINVKKANNKTESGVSELIRVMSVDPELEYSRQNSWTQTYYINCSNVSAIQISVSKQAESNRTNSVRIYSFEVLTEDKESSSLQTLTTLKLVQSSLMPLLKYDFLEKSVCDTILSMVRMSGSLSLAVSLIHLIYEEELDTRLNTIAAASVSQLLQSMDHEEKILNEEAYRMSNADSSSMDIYFDESAKSSRVEITQCGQVASLSAVKSGYQYCMLAAIMDSGVWEWDLSMTAVKDATTCFGVARRPLEEGETISSEAWVLRCDGEVQHGGKVLRKPVGVISPSDVCSFTFDVAAGTVKLSINGNDPHLVFDQVPKGVSPVVFFAETDKSTKLLGVRHRSPEAIASALRSVAAALFNKQPTNIGTATVGASASDSIRVGESRSESMSVSTMLLKKIAKLSEAKISHLITQKMENRRKQSMVFEYPYCIEVSAETMQQLVTLLERVTSSSTSHTNSDPLDPVLVANRAAEKEQQMLAALMIIDSQLYCLSHSEVDPVSVGFFYLHPSTHADEEDHFLESSGSGSTVRTLSGLLTALRQNSNSSEEIRCAAAKTFARGAALFLPSIEDKMELLLSTLSAALQSGFMDSASNLLLRMLLEKLSSHGEVLHVIQLYKTNSLKRRLVMDLLRRLLYMLQTHAMLLYTTNININSNEADTVVESVRNVLPLPIPGQSEFCRIIMSFMSRFQEQLVYDICVSPSPSPSKPPSANSPSDAQEMGDSQSAVNLLVRYFQMLVESCLKVAESACAYETSMPLGTSTPSVKLKPSQTPSATERQAREKMSGALLMPLLHGLVCVCSSKDLELVSGILPVAVKLLQRLSLLTRSSKACITAMHAVNCSIHRFIPRPAVSSGVGGWKTVKAKFEEVEQSYAVSDNGTLYSSIHSSNTCGVVNIGFDKTMRAAWEFRLEADSVNDECSVFGAARMPITSRCYSTSTDLWMRRAYNGYMYAQGITRGAGQEKIHPDDVVRIEFDGKAGTLSFSLNGSDPVIGFTDITETVYPSCGSYRSAVQIRLLKVEVYGASCAETESALESASRCPSSAQWVLDRDKAVQSDADPSILSASTTKTTDKGKDKEKDKENDKAKDRGKSWLTARGEKGAHDGVHDWSFELLQRSHAPFAIGVVVDGDPYPNDVLGGPCAPPGDVKGQKGHSRRALRASSSSILNSVGSASASSSRSRSTARATSSIASASSHVAPSSLTAADMLSGARVPIPHFMLPPNLVPPNRRRGRIRGDSGERDEVRARESVQNSRASVSAVAFQRLLRAAAPEFVPASSMRQVSESDLNLDLDSILAGFLSPNDTESARAAIVHQARILPTSFLAAEEVPFPQDTRTDSDYGTLLPPITTPSIHMADIDMTTLLVDSAAHTEQAMDATRGLETANSLTAALSTAQTPIPISTITQSTASVVRPEAVSVSAEKSEAKQQLKAKYACGMLAMAWHSDGSLWVNGQKLAEGFGSKFLPLDRMSCVTVRIDRPERTVAYYVNGVFVGTAFGPEGCDAAAVFPLPALTGQLSLGSSDVSVKRRTESVVYPAASISLPAAKDASVAVQHSIKLRASGFNGSIVLPLHLALQKTCASVIGRLAAILLSGPVMDKEESLLIPWLRSPLLIGGIDCYGDDTEMEQENEEEEEEVVGDVLVIDIANIHGSGNGNKNENATETGHTDEASIATRVAGVGTTVDIGIDCSDSASCTVPPSGDAAATIPLKGERERGRERGRGHSALDPETSPSNFISWDDAWSTVSSDTGIMDISAEEHIHLHDIYVRVSRSNDNIKEVNHSHRSGSRGTGSRAQEGEMDPFIYRSKCFLDRLSSAKAPMSGEELVVMTWLENILPEHSSLRTVLERSGSYSFPICELPYLACLLKHSGLVREALEAVDTIQNQIQGPSPSDPQFDGKGPKGEGVSMEAACAQLMPSDDMVCVWRRVKQLRVHLRQQRQRLKALDASHAAVPLSADAFPKSLNLSAAESLGGAGAGATGATGTGVEVAVSRTTAEIASDPLSERSVPLSEASPSLAETVGSGSSPLRRHPNGSYLLSPDAVVDTDGDSTEEEKEGDGKDGEEKEDEGADEDVEEDEDDDDEKEEEKEDEISESCVEEKEDFPNEDHIDTEENSEDDAPSATLEREESKVSDLEQGAQEDEGSQVSSNPTVKAAETVKEETQTTVDLKAPVSNKFEELCDLIRSKALFLSRVNPANNGSETDSQGLRSKMLLSNLMSAFKKEEAGDRGDQDRQIPLLRNQSSLTGQERWQKVIEFLRVHSKVRRDVSDYSEEDVQSNIESDETHAPDVGFVESLTADGSAYARAGTSESERDRERDRREGHRDKERDKDKDKIGEKEADITPLQAVLQSCSVFCTAESISVSPARLDAIMSRRTRRASLRVFALQAMAATLSSEAVVGDAFSVGELLLYTRSALTAKGSSKNTTSHYLVNLEGCNADTLGEVQGSFMGLYSSLAKILTDYVDSWEHSSISVLSDFFVGKIEVAAPSAMRCIRSSSADIARFTSVPSIATLPSSPSVSSPTVTRPKRCLSDPNASVGHSPIASLAGTPSRNTERAVRVPDRERERGGRSGLKGSSSALSPSMHSNSNSNSNSLYTPDSAHVLLGPIKMILSLWGLHFSSRDHRFLMQADFLPGVYKLISLVTYERASNAHTVASASLQYFKKRYPSSLYKAEEKWAFWSPAYVSKGLLNGSLTCRSVLLHLMQIPDSVISAEEKESLGLNTDFLNLCSELSLSEVSLLFMRVSMLTSSKEEDERRRKEAKESQEASAALQLEKEMTARLSTCGVFNPDKMGNNMGIEHHNQWVTSRGGSSSDVNEAVCAFTTIEYDLTQGPSITGNYFEVTVLILGEKDIGVGLADQATFPVDSQMPGWKERSYGYHGDDGRKFGHNATPGDWPLFEEGDVIGCGIDMTRRVIFYTLNGSLLGDGFLSVTEDKLTPVVGFSNRAGIAEQVEINFGFKPFRYSGPSIFELLPAVAFRVAEAAAVKEKRDKSLEIAADKNAQPSIGIAGNKMDSRERDEYDVSNEEKRETSWREEKEGEPDPSPNVNVNSKMGVRDEVVVEVLSPLSQADYTATLSLLTRQVEYAAAHVEELQGLQRLGTSLLHFLLMVASREDEEDFPDSSHHTEGEAEAVSPKPSASLALETFTPPRVRLPLKLIAPALVKNISIFGTPKFVTSADSCELLQGLAVSLIQELLIGTQAFTSSSSNSSNSSGRKACRSLDLAPSYKECSSLASIQMNQGIFKNNDPRKIVPAYRSFGSVEATEIESFLYHHLIALDALLPVSDILRRELCSVHTTTALFSLLTRGSVRLHKTVCHILIRTLSDMSPEDVEEALQGDWGETPPFLPFSASFPSASTLSMPPPPLPLIAALPPLLPPSSTATADSNFPMPTLRRRQRRMPDTAVHVLLDIVREALIVRKMPSTATDVIDEKSNGSSSSGSNTSRFLENMRSEEVKCFGQGDTTLESADRHICIVQKLFESPMWKELVACNITDSLRNAGKILRSKLLSDVDSTHVDALGSTSMEAESAREGAGQRALTLEEENVLLSACAACASLSGLGLIRVGGRVKLKDGAIARLVQTNEVEQTAKVYRVESVCTKGATPLPLRALKTLQGMETVKLSELQSQWEAVSVDLSRLSQPLLPHLVALVQQLLQWISMRTGTASPAPVGADEEESAAGESDLVMRRLCAMATTALSVLMERYPDTIMEAAHDIHTVRDIISISSRSTGLPFFPTLPKISEMWGFVQARVLERCSGEGAVDREAVGESGGEREGKSKDQASQSSDTLTAANASSLSAIGNGFSKGPSTSTHTECLMFDGPSRAVRRAVAEALSYELGVSSAKCLIALEFCMGDVDKARRSLRKSSATEGSGFGSSAESAPGSDSAVVKEAEADGVGGDAGEEVRVREGEAALADLDLSDDHPLRNVCESDPLGDISRESSDLPWRSLVPNQIVLRRVALASSSADREGSGEGAAEREGDEEEEGGEKSPSLTADVPEAVAAEGSDGDKFSSSSASSTKSAVGSSADIGSLVTFGSCVARCEEEGATQFPVRAAMGMCMSRGVTSTHTVMSTYDYSLGVPTCEVVEMSSLRAVKKYYDRPVLCMGRLASDLDLSITILRLREIACKLLAEGNLNLHKDAERPEDWVRILRLAVFSECKCSSDPTDSSKCGVIEDATLPSLPAMCSALLLRAKNSPLLPTSSPLPLSLPLSPVPPSAPLDAVSHVMSSLKIDRGAVMSGIDDRDGHQDEVTVGGSARTSDESLEKKIVELLVEDVTESFRVLSRSVLDMGMGNSNGNGRTDSKESEGEVITCASPHPFSSPCSSYGCIAIPPSWRGALIAFHPLCATPSKLASLNFFPSRARYDADSPSHSFYGKPTGESSFKAFALTDVSCIYYRFGAIMGSDRSVIGVESEEGKVTFDPTDGSISIKDSDPFTHRGMGEEDSLFNLFKEPEQDQLEEKVESATAKSDGQGVRQGSWFFEMGVVQCDDTEGEELSLSQNNSVGVIAAFTDGPLLSQGADTDTDMNSAECSVCLTSAGEIVVRKKIHQEVFEVKAMDTELGNWVAGDVIGCLFEIIPYLPSPSLPLPLPPSPLSLASKNATGGGGEDDVEGEVEVAITDSQSSSTILVPFSKVSTSAIDSVQINVWFHRNGVWSERTKICSLPGQSVENCQSLFTLQKKTKFIPNFGESDFNHPPSVPMDADVNTDCDGTHGKEVAVKQLQVTRETPPALSAKDAAIETVTDDHDTVSSKFADILRDGQGVVSLVKKSQNPSLGLMSSWLPLLARPLREEEGPGAWGYHFEVRPLIDLELRVSRDFTLVWSLRPEEGSASTSSSKELFVWRAKTPSSFANIGDIITLTNRPPNGAVIVDKKLCRPAASFVKVFNSKVLELMIWRALPPEGYVALGDVCSKILQPGTYPPCESCYCVPLWAVKVSEIGKKSFSSKRGGGESKGFALSLWASRNLLGTFFGSPHEVARIAPGSGKANVCDGVPEVVYRLRHETLNALTGEWVDEEDVRANKSLLWATSLLSYLLDNPATRLRAMTASVFTAVLNYVRSAAASKPLTAVPLLIRLVHLAHIHAIELPMSATQALCKSILTKAMNAVKSPRESAAPLSDALVGLVDLVVEVQAAEMSAVALRQGRDKSCSSSFDSSTDPDPKPDLNSDALKESERISTQTNGEEGADPGPTDSALSTAVTHEDTKDAEEEEIEAVVREIMAASPLEWWSRRSLTPQDVLSAQVIKDSKLEVLFSRESIIRKLRQVINFLSALSSGSSPSLLFPTLSAAVPLSAPTYPRMILAQIWYNHVSTSFMEESAHPYTARTMKKKVFYPGADKLTVTFDRRCSIGAGAKMTIKSPGLSLDFKGSFGEDLPNGTIFTGCELTIEFSECSLEEALSKDEKKECSVEVIDVDGEAERSPTGFVIVDKPECDVAVRDRAECTVKESGEEEVKNRVTAERAVNVTGEWGWGILIQASGPIYESRVAHITVPPSICPPLLPSTATATECEPAVMSDVMDPVTSRAHELSSSGHWLTGGPSAPEQSDFPALTPTPIPAPAATVMASHTVLFSESSLTELIVTADSTCDTTLAPNIHLPTTFSTPTDARGFSPTGPVEHASSRGTPDAAPLSVPLPVPACTAETHGQAASPLFGMDDDITNSLACVSRPRTRRGREPDSASGTGAGAEGGSDDTPPSPSTLSELFAYPPVTIDIPLVVEAEEEEEEEGVESSVVPSTEMDVDTVGSASASADMLNSPLTTAATASASLSSPSSSSLSSSAPGSNTPPSLSHTPLPFSASLSPPAVPSINRRSVSIPELKVDVRPAKGRNILPSLVSSHSTLEQEQSAVQTHVNCPDKMMAAVAEFGVLLGEGDLMVPHSREMDIKITRKNPKGSTYPSGLPLIKSWKGKAPVLNTDCGTIFVITFTSKCCTDDNDERGEEPTVSRLQIVGGADYNVLGLRMTCRVKASHCHYRVTALSAAETYCKLVKDMAYEYRGLSLSIPLSLTCGGEAKSNSHSSFAYPKGSEGASKGKSAPLGVSSNESGLFFSEDTMVGSADTSFSTANTPYDRSPLATARSVTSAGSESESAQHVPYCPRCARVVPAPQVPCSVCALEEALGGWVLSPPSTATDRDRDTGRDRDMDERDIALSATTTPPAAATTAIDEIVANADADAGREVPAVAIPPGVADEASADAPVDRTVGVEGGVQVEAVASTLPSAVTTVPHIGNDAPHVVSGPMDSMGDGSREPVERAAGGGHEGEREGEGDREEAALSLLEGSIQEGQTPPSVNADADRVEEEGEGGDGDGECEEEEEEEEGDTDEVKKSEDEEDVSDIITVTAEGNFTYVGRFKTRIEGSLVSALNSRRVQDGYGMLLPCDTQSRLCQWTAEDDHALLEYIDQEVGDSASNLFTYPGLTALPKHFLAYRAACLSRMTLLDVQTRILLFEALNKHLEEVIPIVNILNKNPSSLGAMIRKLNKYVFLSVKKPLLDRMIAATTATSGADLPAQLILDNMKSMSSKEGSTNESDVNCFVQAYRQLQAKDPIVYRHVFSTDRVFQISFAAEGGIDAGGVFREGVSRIVEDLFSEHFPLLLLCPNGKHEVHCNMDKYVPNPSLTDPTSLKMLEFIGRLMGMSIRVKLCLPFEFPPLIWKKIAGEKISAEDLMGVDAISCRQLHEIKSCTDEGIVDDSSFHVKYGGKLRFVYMRSDGVEEDLAQGSSDKVVTFNNRLEYCSLVERAKSCEFDRQVGAIEKGMAEVTPMRILKLFSSQQLEVLVAGSPTLDFELWKSKTEASGLTAGTLDLFWSVMASLTPKEQSGFIRFAWGRSRLPAAKDFTTKMKLSYGHSKLPVAHTCFFSIELPEYATEEEMRAGLLTAINFGVGGILMG